MVGDRKISPVVQTPSNERAAVVSPDGKKVAFISDQTGQFEIYVKDFPVGPRTQRVSLQGGTGPLWSKDGKELFFETLDSKTIIAADVLPSGSLRFGPPHALFSIPDPIVGVIFDVTADGQRFLIPQPKNPKDLGINVILNWPALLQN